MIKHTCQSICLLKNNNCFIIYLKHFCCVVNIEVKLNDTQKNLQTSIGFSTGLNYFTYYKNKIGIVFYVTSCNQYVMQIAQCLMYKLEYCIP